MLKTVVKSTNKERITKINGEIGLIRSLRGFLLYLIRDIGNSLVFNHIFVPTISSADFY